MDEFVKEELEELLEGMADDDVVSIWNQYCDANNYCDEEIFFTSDFDDLMCGRAPSEVVEDLSSGFSLNDDYMTYTIYGFASFNYVGDDACPIYISDLAEYILDNDEDFDNDEIRDFLDEHAEEEEDEEEDE